jgi:hypothetical protein
MKMKIYDVDSDSNKPDVPSDVVIRAGAMIPKAPDSAEGALWVNSVSRGGMRALVYWLRLDNGEPCAYWNVVDKSGKRKLRPVPKKWLKKLHDEGVAKNWAAHVAKLPEVPIEPDGIPLFDPRFVRDLEAAAAKKKASAPSGSAAKTGAAAAAAAPAPNKRVEFKTGVVRVSGEHLAKWQKDGPPRILTACGDDVMRALTDSFDAVGVDSMTYASMLMRPGRINAFAPRGKEARKPNNNNDAAAAAAAATAEDTGSAGESDSSGKEDAEGQAAPAQDNPEERDVEMKDTEDVTAATTTTTSGSALCLVTGSLAAEVIELYDTLSKTGTLGASGGVDESAVKSAVGDLVAGLFYDESMPPAWPGVGSAPFHWQVGHAVDGSIVLRELVQTSSSRLGVWMFSVDVIDKCTAERNLVYDFSIRVPEAVAESADPPETLRDLRSKYGQKVFAAAMARFFATVFIRD